MTSKELFEKCKQLIPGGVNSPGFAPPTVSFNLPDRPTARAALAAVFPLAAAAKPQASRLFREHIKRPYPFRGYGRLVFIKTAERSVPFRPSIEPEQFIGRDIQTAAKIDDLFIIEADFARFVFAVIGLIFPQLRRKLLLGQPLCPARRFQIFPHKFRDLHASLPPFFV